MNKIINNDLLNKIQKPKFISKEKLNIETELDIIKRIPDVHKNIELDKFSFNKSNNHLPFIIETWNKSSTSTKSIFKNINHKRESNNKKKVEKLNNIYKSIYRSPLKKLKIILSSSNDSNKVNIKDNIENKQYDNNSAKKPLKMKLEELVKNQKIAAKSTKTIFPKKSIFLTDEDKINNKMNNYLNNRLFKKTKTNIENNYNKNIDIEEEPFIYSNKYQDTVLNHMHLINDYNYKQSFKLYSPRDSGYDFTLKNRLVKKSNFILKLLKTEQTKLQTNYNTHSKKIIQNNKTLEKDEKLFDELIEKQKILGKNYESLYNKAAQKNKDLINVRIENKSIIKENQDEIRRILHKIDKLRAYAYFINEVLGGDITRFEKKIIPEDKYDDEINYPQLSHEVINNYSYLLKNSKFDDGKISINNEIIEHEKTFIFEPEKMWFKFKEIENIIVRNVFTKENIKNEIKKMIEEKNYNLKDLKQRKEILENELEKLKENYDYEHAKFIEVEKRYKSHKNEFDEMINDLFKHTSKYFNEQKSTNNELYDIIDVSKEIYKTIKNTEIYIDGLTLSLEKYKKEDANLFIKILDNRKKYLKWVKAQSIINQKMKEKFNFMFDKDKSNGIIFKSRKTEAPYHKPKKEKKEKIDKSLIERIENEEILTYEKEDDE